MVAPTFTPDTEKLLERAEAFCASRQQRLTEQRRQVLGLILDSPRPSGAYDLLDRLRIDGKPAAPPTVYRALEFLTAQGLVHKIERLAAFVGCAHMLQPEAHGHCGHSHGRAERVPAIQFLICTRCRRVFEMTDDRIRTAIEAAAQATGFHPAGATVEIEGICAECAQAPAPNQIA
ncbi:MAG TPA: Fur family transcriptional regulator [Acidisoma sp.]|jgi:Fur family zinc uptake transcriptional regulator|nr:Fur family transcriptional regulator [Acidisoma sp.]